MAPTPSRSRPDNSAHPRLDVGSRIGLSPPLLSLAGGGSISASHERSSTPRTVFWVSAFYHGSFPIQTHPAISSQRTTTHRSIPFTCPLPALLLPLSASALASSITSFHSTALGSSVRVTTTAFSESEMQLFPCSTIMPQRPETNKTDSGNGSKAFCHVTNVLRSPSPDPRGSKGWM